MKILLIGNRQTSETPEKYYGEYIDFFRSAAVSSRKEVEFSLAFFDDLYIQVGDGVFIVRDTKSQKNLNEFDAIFIRGKGFRQSFDIVRAVSKYAVLHNIPVVNNYSNFRDSSKLAQAVQFYEAGLPVSTTVYANAAALSGNEVLPFPFPCILKAVFGAHGNDNYLVHSLEEAREIVENSDLRFVLQRFVPNERDFRLLVVGDEVIAIGRKAVEGSHLNNTSQGGSAELVPLDQLPQGMVQGALHISRALDMTIAGVDTLIDKNTGEYYFLEVNSQPQLMSGAFIEEKAKLLGRYFDALGE